MTIQEVIGQADIYDVAIIGGGFSGLMVLHHLAQASGGGSRFAVIEPEERLGYGLAYRTTNPQHLLNVPAGKMSALPERPDHFIEWLASVAGRKASTAMGLSRVWTGGDYVPRCLYAAYLEGIGRATFLEAEEKGVRLSNVRHKAADIGKADGFYKLTLDNGEILHSRAIVLATGNLSAISHDKIPGVVEDPWRHDHAALSPESGTAAIIGTGLTMIDTVISLRTAGFTGDILAVSRRGLLPEIHDDTPAAPFLLSVPSPLPEKLVPLMRTLRREAKACLPKQITWQRAFDLWRPHTVALWGKLDTRDRTRFFDRLFTLWNVHRHRMAPQIGVMIKRELAAGKLKVLKGAVKITAEKITNGPCLTVGGKQYDVVRVFDCRGVCHDIRRTGNKLIASLCRQGLLQPHETGRGIRTNSEQQVLPAGQDGSFLAVGPLLIGEYLETTAVPELRQQAQKAALAVACYLRSSEEAYQAIKPISMR